MPKLSSEYLEYIDSDEWRIRRALKLLLAGALTGAVQCEICRRHFVPRGVDGHHETYERLGAERMEDLAVLCRSCHECIKEIVEIVDGGPVDEISDRLMAMLVAIDNRLARRSEDYTPKNETFEDRPRGELSLNQFIEHLAKRRSELGIKLTPRNEEN